MTVKWRSFPYSVTCNYVHLDSIMCNDHHLYWASQIQSNDYIVLQWPSLFFWLQISSFFLFFKGKVQAWNFLGLFGSFTPLKACEIPRSVSKTVNNFFHYGFHLQPKKKGTHTAETMSVLSVAIFWVVNASSGKKSCLQFSIPTGSGTGGEGGVSHRLNCDCSILATLAKQIFFKYLLQFSSKNYEKIWRTAMHLKEKISTSFINFVLYGWKKMFNWFFYKLIFSKYFDRENEQLREMIKGNV